MDQKTKQPKNLSEFLEWERFQDRRYEFISGEPRVLGHEKKLHADVVENLRCRLKHVLNASACDLYDRSYKVIAQTLAIYPDIVVTQTLEDKQFQAPLFIAEVTSPNSAREDRGDRWAAYQTLPSLLMYMIVDQQRPRVEVYTRTCDSGWHYQSFCAPGAVLPLWAEGLSLPLREIYACER
ncbi:MAG: Uma2 family endonuclease [Nannocystaceae bacterium]